MFIMTKAIRIIIKGWAVMCFLVFCADAFGQDPKIANQAFNDGNYFKSLELYGKLLQREPDNMEYNYRLGQCYLRTQVDPKRALDFLIVAEEMPRFPAEGWLELAEAYSYHLQYDEALSSLRKYEEEGNVKRKNKADFDRLVANYSMATELLKYPAEVTFQNLGPLVNSTFADYHPFVNKNENILIFTSRRKSKPGQSPEFDGYYPSNIYMSEREPEGEWKEAVKLSDRINTLYDEQAVGLTDSGDSLFFYVDHVNSFGNIYLSERVNNVFGDPKPLTDIVNTDYVESACSISRDGKTLIFSSDRPGGAGGLDIWMRRKLPSGEWGEPLNLGLEINTPFHEDFPTLSGDGKTLYFCSDGHPGMGNFDLFFSTWDFLENTWSKPQNLGFPINTPSNEKSISFNDYGDRAYITALRPEGRGDLDIYEVTYLNLREAMPAVFMIAAPLLEQAAPGNIPHLRVKNENDELIGEYAANKITGKFILALYPGKYSMSLEGKGFKPYREELVVNSAHMRQEKNLKTLNLEKK